MIQCGGRHQVSIVSPLAGDPRPGGEPTRPAAVAARRALVLLVAIVGLAAVLTRPVQGQEQPIFRADADLAVVRVVVLNDGKPALGLQAEDFRVVEDGIERPISVFIPPVWEPMELVLAFDSSGSMNAWPAKEAATVLLDSLHPGSCVLLLPFQESIQQGIWAHPRDPRLRQRIADLEFAHNEAIYDALLASFVLMRGRSRPDVAAQSGALGQNLLGGSELMRFRGAPGLAGLLTGLEAIPDPEGECMPQCDPWSPALVRSRSRQAIVVVTDGQDFSSHSDLDDVLLVAWGSSLPVFVLAAEARSSSGGFGSMGRPSHYGTMRKLNQLIEYTGGAMFRATRGGDQQEVWNELQRLIAGLRSQYVLGYVPSPRDGEGISARDRREITVRVRGGDHEVLAPDHIVRGMVATENAVQELIHGGFQQIAAGRMKAALGTLDAAMSAAPGQAFTQLGTINYGRGIALSRLGQPAAALQELRLAAERTAWLPDLEARQAELLLELGDFDEAWRHALRGRAQGSDVNALIERLQELAPRDDGELPGRSRDGFARVALAARGTGDAALQGIAVPRILGAVARILARSATAVLARGSRPDDGRSGLDLLVDVHSVRQRGARIEAQGWLVLSDASGDKLCEARLRLRDVRSADEVAAVVATAMREVQAAIDEHLRAGE